MMMNANICTLVHKPRGWLPVVSQLLPSGKSREGRAQVGGKLVQETHLVVHQILSRFASTSTGVQLSRFASTKMDQKNAPGVVERLAYLLWAVLCPCSSELALARAGLRFVAFDQGALRVWRWWGGPRFRRRGRRWL